MSRPTPVIVLLFKRECWGGCHTAAAENSQECSNHPPPPAQVFAHLARSDEEKLVLREKGSRAVVSLRWRSSKADPKSGGFAKSNAGYLGNWRLMDLQILEVLTIPMLWEEEQWPLSGESRMGEVSPLSCIGQPLIWAGGRDASQNDAQFSESQIRSPPPLLVKSPKKMQKNDF